MTCKDLTYRIIKIGKTTCSVAVIGFLMMGGGVASAETFNTATYGTTIAPTLSTNSLDLIYYNNSNSSDTDSRAATVNLAPGVNLTGESINGSGATAGLAVFSREVRDNVNSSNIDRFSLSNTTLNLSGNNTLTGLVGVRVNLDTNTTGNFYGSYTATPLSVTNINGPSVTFNRQLFSSTINLNTGASVSFLGDVGDSTNTTVLDYKGNNASVTLNNGINFYGTMVNVTSSAGDKTNGSLYLLGSSSISGTVGDTTSGLSLVRMSGSGSTVNFGNGLTTDWLDFAVSSTVNVTGSLIMNTDAAPGAVHAVRFNDSDGTLSIIGGNLTGVLGTPVASTSVVDRGTLTFQGTGSAQTVTGGLGASGLGLKLINVGDATIQNASSLTVNGNIFATTVALNNDGATTHSSLTLGSGYSLTATNLNTDANGMGRLYLAGGTQTIDALVGSVAARLDLVQSGVTGSNATFVKDVYANTVENISTGTGTSNFQGTVTATDVKVNEGQSNFAQAVTANSVTIISGTGTFSGALNAGTSGATINPTAVSIGTGTGTFNGTTHANLTFTGAGTANLNQGLTGTVAFAGQTATVNLADGQTITGAISTTANSRGTLNALGDGVLGGQVGANTFGMAALRVNTSDAQGTANGLLANESIWAVQTELLNKGTLTLAAGKSLTGTGTTTALITDTNNEGNLRFLGSGDVSGGVGTSEKAIKLIDGSLSQGTTHTFTGAVYAQTIDMDANNKTATFNNAVTATTVKAGGTASALAFQQGLTTHRLNYGTSSTAAVTVTGNLTLTSLDNATGLVNFTGSDSTLSVINGNLVGQAGSVAVATTANNTGTVNLQRSAGAQTVTGGLGESGKALKAINIGTNAQTATTINGDIFATSTTLNSGSTLTLAEGRSLTGTSVTTATTNTGELRLAGGTQTVDAAVGTNTARLKLVQSGVNGSDATFKQTVFATTVENIGTGSSTFEGAVTATDLKVDAGNSTFSANAPVNATNLTITTGQATFNAAVNATNTAIGTGSGVFNASTTTSLSFTGAGRADLNQGLTGTVAFAGQAATVNLADAQTISGAITTATTNNTGSLLVLGDGTLQGAVGAANMGIAQLRVNTAGTQSTTQGLLAQGDIFAGQTTLTNNGTLTLATGKNLTGTDGTKTAVITTANNTGVLRLEGSSTITGGVGESGAALKRVEAGVAGSTVTLNGKTYAESVELGSTGTVRLEDTLTGKVDFKRAGGTLELKDGLNLDTAVTTFSNANAAILRFAGSSTVTGQLGSANNDNENQLKDVYAGTNGSVVTFKNDVYLKSTTLHVVGTGVVNLQGSLYAPVQFDLNGNGSVNVGSGQQVTGAVTTATAGTGTLNFVGDANTANTMGASDKPLLAVNFHAATTDATNLPLKNAAATINVGHNIYANTTTAGNANQNTTLNITANGLNLGTALTLGSRTVLNTAGTVTRSASNSVEFGHSTNANGSLTTAATVTRSTTGTGTIATGGATLNFALATEALGGQVDPTLSSSITGGAGSTLTMTGNETVHAALLGSMRNGASHRLIDVQSGDTAVPSQLYDNSYVMNTSLSRVDGDLVLTVNRDASTYIVQSGTQGHVSNPAARRLGELAAAGTGYGLDMQTVLNKLDLDQWGYGNNQANLATQVKRLAPVANRSYGVAMLDATSLGLNHIGDRLKDLRSVEASGGEIPKAVWLRSGYANARQSGASGMDGFNNTYTGFTLGGDLRTDARSMVGLALSYGSTRVKQSDFRLGDAGDVKSLQLTAYGAFDLTDRFYADAMISAGKQDITGHRATVIDRVASTDHDARGQAIKLNLGYRMPVAQSSMVLTPVLSYESLNVREDAYTETNAGDVGLQVDAQRHRRSQLGLGVRLGGTTQGLGGLVVKPELGVMLLKDSSANHGDSLSARYVGEGAAGTGFRTDLANVGDTTARMQLGLGVLMSKTSSLSIRYQRDQRSQFKADAAELLLRWDF